MSNPTTPIGSTLQPTAPSLARRTNNTAGYCNTLPRCTTPWLIATATYLFSRIPVVNAEPKCIYTKHGCVCMDYENMSLSQRAILLSFTFAAYLYIFHDLYPAVTKKVMIALGLLSIYFLLDEIFFNNYDLEDFI